MDCLEVNLNVKAVIVYQGFLTQSQFLLTKKNLLLGGFVFVLNLRNTV